MALAALVLLALLVVVVVVLAVRQVRLGVQHERTRLLVDALDARVGGVQRRLEEVPGIGTGRHEVALVLNPIKTHADRVRRELERLAEAEGLGEVLVLETKEDDPGTAMARQALDAGARLVIAAGGDGTVRTVAEQLAGTDVALGVVPLGTGNLLARNLDLPINDVEQCLRIAVGGRQRRIDTVDVRFTHEDGRVTRQTFTVIGGAGYDADIMGDTKDELKSLAGWLAYSEAGMRHLRGKRHEVTVALDGGQPRRFKVRTVMVANCGMLTGGVELLPQAKLDDGLLDVMVLSPRHALDWARIAVKTVTRHRSSVPAMHTEQAQRVKVEFAEPMPSQLDGDATGVITALDARVQPDSLVVMLVAEDDASVRDDGVSAAAPVPEPAPHICPPVPAFVRETAVSPPFSFGKRRLPQRFRSGNGRLTTTFVRETSAGATRGREARRRPVVVVIVPFRRRKSLGAAVSRTKVTLGPPFPERKSLGGRRFPNESAAPPQRERRDSTQARPERYAASVNSAGTLVGTGSAWA